MKLINHDEALTMAQDTLIWKNLPEKLQPMFLTSMMDLSDEIQAQLVARSTTRLDDDERQTMREHILFLGKALEQERANSVRKTRLLQRMLDPEDLGWAVSHEVRMIAYEILSQETYSDRDKENKQ